MQPVFGLHETVVEVGVKLTCHRELGGDTPIVVSSRKLLYYHSLRPMIAA